MRFSLLPLAVFAAWSMACGGSSGTTTLLGDASVSTTSDGGPGGNTQNVACGSNACSIPAQSCCVYETQPTWSYACIDGTSCPVLDAGAGTGGGGQGTALACSGAANCADGTVCCVYENANKQVQSSCMSSCPANGAQLCDPNAPVSGCAASAACSTANISDWGLPKGFATCGGIGN
jgi:hypothetical protein